MLSNVLSELKPLGRGLRAMYRQVWPLFCLFCPGFGHLTPRAQGTRGWDRSSAKSF